LEERVAGQLLIGCTTTAGKYVLPLVAAAFGQHHPNVRVTIEMCSCASVADPLLAQEIHVGISNTKVVHLDLECQPFFTDHMVLVVFADHPFVQRPSVQPIELLDQPFILREEGSSQAMCFVVQGLVRTLQAMREAGLLLWSVSFINPKMAELKNQLPPHMEHGHVVEDHCPTIPEGYVAVFVAPASRREAIEAQLPSLLSVGGGEPMDDEVVQHEWQERFHLMHVKSI